VGLRHVNTIDTFPDILMPSVQRGPYLHSVVFDPRAKNTHPQNTGMRKGPASVLASDVSGMVLPLRFGV
jgi:hypothetical protein